MSEPTAPEPGPEPPSIEGLDQVEALGPESAGRWLVHSRDGEHLFDLDAGSYRRTPGPGRSRFAHDGHTVKLTRVERWPRVGDQSIWVDDHREPDLIEHWHQSSTIASISQAVEDLRDMTVGVTHERHRR